MVVKLGQNLNKYPSSILQKNIILQVKVKYLLLLTLENQDLLNPVLDIDQDETPPSSWPVRIKQRQTICEDIDTDTIQHRIEDEILWSDRRKWDINDEKKGSFGRYHRVVKDPFLCIHWCRSKFMYIYVKYLYYSQKRWYEWVPIKSYTTTHNNLMKSS